MHDKQKQMNEVTRYSSPCRKISATGIGSSKEGEFVFEVDIFRFYFELGKIIHIFFERLKVFVLGEKCLTFC
jgi:hypothetical protein